MRDGEFYFHKTKFGLAILFSGEIRGKQVSLGMTSRQFPSSHSTYYIRPDELKVFLQFPLSCALIFDVSVEQLARLVPKNESYGNNEWKLQSSIKLYDHLRSIFVDVKYKGFVAPVAVALVLIGRRGVQIYTDRVGGQGQTAWEIVASDPKCKEALNFIQEFMLYNAGALSGKDFYSNLQLAFKMAFKTFDLPIIPQD